MRVWDLYHQKFTAKVDKVVIIQLIDNTTEMMVISQFGKIIRIDTKSVRAAGRSTSSTRTIRCSCWSIGAYPLPPVKTCAKYR